MLKFGLSKDGVEINVDPKTVSDVTRGAKEGCTEIHIGYVSFEVEGKLEDVARAIRGDGGLEWWEEGVSGGGPSEGAPPPPEIPDNPGDTGAGGKPKKKPKKKKK